LATINQASDTTGPYVKKTPTAPAALVLNEQQAPVVQPMKYEVRRDSTMNRRLGSLRRIRTCAPARTRCNLGPQAEAPGEFSA
jgi:hypothetical protein